jgi:hypothetical protein
MRGKKTGAVWDFMGRRRVLMGVMGIDGKGACFCGGATSESQHAWPLTPNHRGVNGRFGGRFGDSGQKSCGFRVTLDWEIADPALGWDFVGKNPLFPTLTISGVHCGSGIYPCANFIRILPPSVDSRSAATPDLRASAKKSRCVP